MPSIGEMLIGSALQSSREAPDISGSLQKGAQMGTQLAQHIEQVRQNRLQNEQQKQELYVNKIGKVAGMYETAAKLPPGKAREAMLREAIPNAVTAFSLDKEFPPLTQKMFNSHPEVVEYLNSKVTDGTFTLPQLIEQAQDAQWVAQQIPEAIRMKAGEAFEPNVSENLEILKEADQKRIEFAEKSKNAALQAGTKQAQRDVQNPMDLRKELVNHPTTRTTIDMTSSYEKMRSTLGSTPSAAGDLAGVFVMMKMLDPGSTVNRGEHATAQNAAGVSDQIANIYNKLVDGQSLTAKQRKDFLTQGERMYRDQYNKQMLLNKDMEDIAKATGIKPQLIFAGTRFKAPPPEKKDGKSYDIGGQKMSKEQAKGFLTTNPQFITPELKKDLGL